MTCITTDQNLANISAEDELMALFADVPKTIAEDTYALQKAAEALESDAHFQATCLKSKFVAAILGAMDKYDYTQSEVARKWSRTRQYLNKILNEDNRVNFTIDTMVELGMILNQRIDLHILDKNEDFVVMYCTKLPDRDVSPGGYTQDIDFKDINQKLGQLGARSLYCNYYG